MFASPAHDALSTDQAGDPPGPQIEGSAVLTIVAFRSGCVHAAAALELGDTVCACVTALGSSDHNKMECDFSHSILVSPFPRPSTTLRYARDDKVSAYARDDKVSAHARDDKVNAYARDDK
ncbi:MAG TPA: hypothetical protein VMD07_03975 [Candidatus Acidoferrales bacterium]|nr:hypothetical protein [Candidatus Acidoferrales bacterium]